MKLPPSRLFEYFNGLIYRLGEREDQSESLFRDFVSGRKEAVLLMWSQLEKAASEGRRLTSEEGRFLLTEDAPLLELGALAQFVGRKRQTQPTSPLSLTQIPTTPTFAIRIAFFVPFTAGPKTKTLTPSRWSR